MNQLPISNNTYLYASWPSIEQRVLKISELSDDQCIVKNFDLLTEKLKKNELFHLLKNAIERGSSNTVIAKILERSSAVCLTVNQVQILLGSIVQQKRNSRLVISEVTPGRIDITSSQDNYALLLKSCDPESIGENFVDLCGKIPKEFISDLKSICQIPELEWNCEWNQWIDYSSTNSPYDQSVWHMHCKDILHAIAAIEKISITSPILLYTILLCHGTNKKIAEAILLRVDRNFISSEMMRLDEKCFLNIPKNNIGKSKYVINLFENIDLIGQESGEFEKDTTGLYGSDASILKIKLDSNSSVFLSSMKFGSNGSNDKLIYAIQEVRRNIFDSRKDIMGIVIIKSNFTCENNKIKKAFIEKLRDCTKLIFSNLNSNWTIERACSTKHCDHDERCYSHIIKSVPDFEGRVFTSILRQIAIVRGFQAKLNIYYGSTCIIISGATGHVRQFYDILRDETLAAEGVEETLPLSLSRLIIRDNFHSSKAKFDPLDKRLPPSILEKVKNEAPYCLNYSRLDKK